MTARRHHFVPQCYLRSFAVPRKAGKYQLHVFDRQTGKTFQTATENIALERDFNRVDVEGHPSDALEAGLAAFEGQLAPALERTRDAAAFQSDEDKNLIFNLIGNLGLRNPRWRESMRQFHEDSTKAMMDLALASKERWDGQIRKAVQNNAFAEKPEITYEEMKEFHEGDQYKIALDSGYRLRMEMDMLDTVLPLLARRKWMFLKAPINSGGFITSDHPVCLMWSEPGRNGPFNSPGFGLHGTELVMPLSPKLALVGAFEIDDGVKEVSEPVVEITNGMVAGFTTRQAYSRDLHFRYRFQDGEGARKASRLIDDARFIRRKE